MVKFRKFVVVVIIINIIFGFLGLFQNNIYAKQYTSSNIDEIDDDKYPGIKQMIKDVKAQHPNWQIEVFYTGLDFEDVIYNEYKDHGKNLVSGSYYVGDWICSVCGDKKYDGGRWSCASQDALRYMIDPRNSLNSIDIFQFLKLSYIDCTYEDLKPMVKNCSYLNDDLLKDIIDIGKEYSVNPYFIVAKIIQEQGSGTSPLVTGKEYVGTDNEKYSGYYNFFNVNATASKVDELITKGLAYAKKHGWDTPQKSIEGGVSLIANNYIKYGQDTMYFEKFNVSSTKYKYYEHQYMQNILAAQNEGTKLRSGLASVENALEGNYTFVIPLYENMPENACKVPSRVSTSKTYTLGDTNNDGVINSGDLLVVKKHLLGSKVVTDKNCLLAMDVNKDGSINSGDLLLIKKHLLGTYKITN